MSSWSQTFTFLDGEWIEGNTPVHRRAHPRLLAGLERVRRRARLRGRDPRPRQALRPPQPFGENDVAEAVHERGGDGRTRARGRAEVHARGRSLYPADVLGRTRRRDHRCSPIPNSTRFCLSLYEAPLPAADRHFDHPLPLRQAARRSPCRSTPRPAASIRTTPARCWRPAPADSTIACSATCSAMSPSSRPPTSSSPRTGS